MSGSGATCYNEELKELLRLLKHLPDTIPLGDDHNFIGYVPDPEKVVDTGCVKTVVSHALEVSFGARKQPGPDGARITVVFKSRGPGLEEVVQVLRDHITGNAGTNVILVAWVDDLRDGAVAAISTAGTRVPRPIATTAAKRLLEDDLVEEQAKKKSRKDSQGEKQRKKAEVEKAKKKTDQGVMNWPIDDLTDDELPQPINPLTSRARGAPRNDILDKFTIACHTKSSNKPRFRCSASGCHMSWAAPRQTGRGLSHVVDCRFMSEELKEQALLSNAENSLSSKVEAASTSGTSSADAFAGFRRAGAEEKAKARENHITKTNLLVLELLCDASLPPDWLITRNSVGFTYIPAEAARVTALSLANLKKCYNLTLGYDGGTVKKGQSIYTFHVTTPDTREPHFVHGDVASGLSHTAEHLKTIILSIIKKIGAEHFAAIGCDSTGDTKLARELVADVIRKE
ncbi:hypothetical protein B0H10DRAFT_2440556 [Mycena sp. CBHHK59/15]|nr:hypothetical protein B0H10DRAFT_2440556 [Mycena sp. CBHHK59/15]